MWEGNHILSLKKHRFHALSHAFTLQAWLLPRAVRFEGVKIGMAQGLSLLSYNKHYVNQGLSVTLSNPSPTLLSCGFALLLLCNSEGLAVLGHAIKVFWCFELRGVLT